MCVFLIAACGGQANETTINLLLLIPWAERNGQGYGLSSGARVAVSEVNNNSNILPGYRINLIESRHEACGQIQSTQGLINMVRYAINPHNPVNVAAIMGLYCSTTTRTISPVASKFDIIHLTAANLAPAFHATTYKYPHLWQFIKFTSSYADMMLSIMDRFGWNRIAVVNELINVSFQNIGDSLIEAVHSSDKAELVYHGSLSSLRTDERIKEVITGIRESASVIVFLSLSASRAVQFLCEAGRHNMSWPNYVWIIVDNKAENLFSYEASRPATCSLDMLKYTVENSISSFFALEPLDPHILLASNDSYSNYKRKYNIEHQHVANSSLTSVDFSLGSVAYDQVWAFSLALHKALPELKEKNISIEDYGYGQPNNTAILERYLASVDFNGSSGHISFDNDRTRTVSIIQIFQVRNSVDVRVGMFDFSDTNIFHINISDPPTDSVTSHPVVIPLELAVITWIVLFALVIFVTVNLVLMMYNRKHSEIKATSPLLSCTIMIGCYLECISAIMFVVQVSIEDPPMLGFTVLCNIEFFFGMFGMYLILLTALLKLIRIFRIFYSPNRLEKQWKDISLFIIVVIVSNYATFIFIIWIPVDLMEYKINIKYNTDSLPVTAKQIGVCTSQHLWIWLGFLCALVIFILIALTLFATVTRKIQHQSFKDTKKIIFFAYAITLTITVYFIVYQILASNEVFHFACYVLSLLYATVCLFTQCILFVPKLYPLPHNIWTAVKINNFV